MISFALICQKTGEEMNYTGMTKDDTETELYIRFECQECNHSVLVKMEKDFETYLDRMIKK